MQPGTAPKPIMTRHILSTASPQTPPQFATLVEVIRDCLKPETTIKATIPAANWPIPCMAKTEPIIAPRHLVVANLSRSEGPGEETGGTAHNLLGCDDAA